MGIEELKEIIASNNIDKLISYSKCVKPEYVQEALRLYEKHYEKELDIAKTIQDILIQIKIKRIKNKIPNVGNYSYKLEE